MTSTAIRQPNRTLTAVREFQNISTCLSLSCIYYGDPRNQNVLPRPLYNSTERRIAHLIRKPKPSSKNLFRNLKSYSKDKMISCKKLFTFSQEVADGRCAAERIRISFHWTSSKKNPGDSQEATVMKKGHFAIYTTDGRQFEVPLSYLAGEVIRELFALSEEGFRIPGVGPIVLSINVSAMDHVMSMIRQGLASEQEKALLESLSRCSRIYFTANEDRACPQITSM